MDKKELERMLMDPDELKKLTERANSIKLKEGMAERSDVAVEKMQAVEPLFHEIRPTSEEIKLNSDDFAISVMVPDVAQFFPDLAKEDPKKVLSVLMERCKKEPTEGNQLLVENAINRLTMGGILDRDAEKLVPEAIEMLTVTKKGSKQEGKIDSIWARVYEHSNYNGRSALLNHGPGWVYRLFQAKEPRNINLKSISRPDDIIPLTMKV